MWTVTTIGTIDIVKAIVITAGIGIVTARPRRSGATAGAPPSGSAIDRGLRKNGPACGAIFTCEFRSVAADYFILS
jgi:hypothetical protein